MTVLIVVDGPKAILRALDRSPSDLINFIVKRCASCRLSTLEEH